jgi:hypothetical protein
MNNAAKLVLVVVGAAIAGVGSYMMFASSAAPTGETPRSVLADAQASSASDATGASQEVGSREILVYKTATCGCCSNWVEYMKGHGFTVKTQDVTDLVAIKVEHGVPPGLQTCHTAVVDGYLVEGHVPIESIQRMLEERPEIAGLAVPGMPTGSPGMEVPGQAAASYDIIAFDRDGNTSVYDSR